MKISMMLRVLTEMVPYDTMVRVSGIDHDVCLDSVSRYGEVGVNDGTTNLYSIDDVKPYLRPMSSMTEEEKGFSEQIYKDGGFWAHFDWFNAHHFDYRRLISMGLALEAPEWMYKTE